MEEQSEISINTSVDCAYLFLACDYSERAIHELRTSSARGSLSIFMDVEGRADQTGEIWTLDWQEDMDRIAPVQLTLAWNPLPLLLHCIELWDCEIAWKAGSFGKDGNNFILFSTYNDGMPHDLLPHGHTHNESRFIDILKITNEIAIMRNRHILFVCEDGWNYESDSQDLEIPSVQDALKSSGLRISTRR